MQEDGGPIGLRFTGALAKLRMARWARDFVTLLKKHGVKLHKAAGYVDDLRFIINMLELGTRWTGKHLAWTEAWENEDLSAKISRQKRTAIELNKMMNQISRDIQMTVELPEEFRDEYIPTLDVKLKVVLMRREDLRDPSGNIRAQVNSSSLIPQVT